MKPFYERAGVTIFHGDGVEIGLALAAEGVRGLVVVDPPYSRKVHSKSRAGARKTPLLDGNGHLTRCAIDREKVFGFDHLTPALRHGLARAAYALANRWVMFFCDEESAWLWRHSLTAVGMEYIRTCRWIKQCATPQFTGDRPGSHDEAIVLAHAMGPKGKPIKKHWNGGGKGNLYTAQVVQEHRPGCGEPRENETQKPERLLTDILSDFGDPGDTVIDLTMGSGTALVCARRLGFRAYGVDMREGQCEAAAKRIDAEIDNTTMRAREAGQMGLFG